MKEQNKGVLFGFGSSVFNSTVHISSKYLLQFVNQPTFLAIWFVLATIPNLIIALLTRKTKLFLDLKLYWKAGLIIALTNVVASAMFFTSIRFNGPAPTAFLAKLDVIFVVILSFLFLKEKLNRNELIGISIALLGAVMFSFVAVNFTPWYLFGVLAGLGIAVNSLFARHYTQKISVWTLQLFRTGISGAIYLTFALVTGYFLMPELNILLLAFVGAFLSAVVGIGFLYSALKRLRASIVTMIRNFDPFLVAIYAYPIFGTFPTLKEWAGGLLIIIGVTVTILAMNKDSNKIYKKSGDAKVHG